MKSKLLEKLVAEFLYYLRNFTKKFLGGKTAERLLPQFYEQNLADKILFAKHQFAYNYVCKKYCHHRMRILDYGCGDGYGSDTIASFNPDLQIIGTDIDKNTVKQAIKKYKQDNLEFMTLEQLKQSTVEFDLIVSFQVIEHVMDVNGYLHCLKNRLSVGGILVVSTPNRNYRLSENQAPWNPYHIREYSYDFFKQEIENVFEQSEFYSLSAISEILYVEYNRVAMSRNDKKVYKVVEKTNNIKGANFADFWLTKENMEDGLDLFSFSVNKKNEIID